MPTVLTDVLYRNRPLRHARVRRVAAHEGDWHPHGPGRGTRLVTHLLYRSAAADWAFHVASAVLIALVGLLASLMPARRAAAVEPLVALRHE